MPLSRAVRTHWHQEVCDHSIRESVQKGTLKNSCISQHSSQLFPNPPLRRPFGNIHLCFLRLPLGLSRSPLVFSLSVIEIVPTQQQYPADWDSWKVDHHLQEEFKLPQVWFFICFFYMIEKVVIFSSALSYLFFSFRVFFSFLFYS